MSHQNANSMTATVRASYTCARCFEARAVRGTDYCAACGVIVANEAARVRYTRQLARNRARKLGAADVRDGLEAFGCFAGQALPVIHNGYRPEQVGRRCIGTLNRREWFAGIICAQDDAGAWVYMPDASGREGAGRELHVPILKVPWKRIEVVE